MRAALSLHWRQLLLVLLVTAIGVRLVAMMFVPLLPEEAYYWMYAQHPGLSYFDHPPMVAWIIQAGTLVFGDSELGVRITGSALMLGASALMYGLSRIWTGRRESLIAAVALQALPAYFATGFIATMDAPLLLFWLVCLIGISLALRRGRCSGWYIAALGLGGAMLSKYTGAFLGLGALIAMLGVPAWRKQFFSIHPYIATGLALAMFSPVIIWNAQHDWASFRFQFGGRFIDKGFSTSSMLGFAGGQFLVATPLLLGGVAWIIVRAVRQRRVLTPRNWFMISFSVPLLGVMAYKSLKYSIHINWTLPAYLVTLPPVAQLCMAMWRQQTRHIPSRAIAWMPALRWTSVACLGIDIAITVYLLTLQPKFRTPSDFGPWKNLAAAVEDLQDRLEAETKQQPLIIANGEYRLASILAFYCTPLDQLDGDDELARPVSNYVTSQWFIRGSGLGYEYWGDPQRWIGRDCIFVNDKRDLLKNLANRFRSVELVSDPRLPVGGKYQMAICRGYRGPVPPKPSPVNEPRSGSARS